MSHSPSPRPANADPVGAPAYRLTVDYLGVRQISTHPDNDRAYRALIAFAVTTDFDLLAQRRDTRQRYALLDIAAPHQRNPRIVGHAVIEQQCCNGKGELPHRVASRPPGHEVPLPCLVRDTAASASEQPSPVGSRSATGPPNRW